MRLLVPGVVAALLAAVAPVLPARAAEVAGVRFEDRIRVGETVLGLRGLTLMRWRWVFEVYVAGLYLPADIPSSRALDDVPKQLEIEYFYGFSPADFAGATRNGIYANVDEATYAQLETRIEALNALYRPVEPGDRYALRYVPGRGTALLLNGEVLGRVQGADFAAALYAIWLGDRPVDDVVKRGLLGNP